MDAYIFDLDGTLLDTLDDLAASANHALAVFGMPTHSTDDIRRFVGNGVRKLMERAVPDGERNPLFEEVLNTFRKYYMEHERDTTQPYPGIIPLLRHLKTLNKSVAVVSTRSRHGGGSTATIGDSCPEGCVYRRQRRGYRHGSQLWNAVHQCALGIPRPRIPASTWSHDAGGET